MKQDRIQINVTLKEAELIRDLIINYGVQYEELNYQKIALRLEDMIQKKYRRVIMSKENPYEYTKEQFRWSKQATDIYLARARDEEGSKVKFVLTEDGWIKVGKPLNTKI